jgi:hypothetical protein
MCRATKSSYAASRARASQRTNSTLLYMPTGTQSQSVLSMVLRDVCARAHLDVHIASHTVHTWTSCASFECKHRETCAHNVSKLLVRHYFLRSMCSTFCPLPGTCDAPHALTAGLVKAREHDWKRVLSTLKAIAADESENAEENVGGRSSNETAKAKGDTMMFGRDVSAEHGLGTEKQWIVEEVQSIVEALISRAREDEGNKVRQRTEAQYQQITLQQVQQARLQQKAVASKVCMQMGFVQTSQRCLILALAHINLRWHGPALRVFHRSCTHSLTTKVQESAVAEVKKELMARIKELEAVIAEQEHALQKAEAHRQQITLQQIEQVRLQERALAPTECMQMFDMQRVPKSCGCSYQSMRHVPDSRVCITVLAPTHSPPRCKRAR